MEHEVMAGRAADEITASVLLGLAVIVAVAFVFARLAERLRQPGVMGEIVAGIALGPSLLGLLPGHLTERLFPPDARPFLQVLAQLGLVLFMFGVGHAMDLTHLRGAGRQVLAVSLGSFALPFALGFGLATALYPWFAAGGQQAAGERLIPALFVGTAMSVTAFPVLARILHQRGMAQERTGGVSLACAAVQDVLAWSVLAAVVVAADAGSPASVVRMIAELLVLAVGLTYVVRPFLRQLLAPGRRWSGSVPARLALMVSGTLACAWATTAMGLHAVFGAFAFGMAVPRGEVDAQAQIEQTGLLLLPTFFVVTGLSVRFGELGPRELAVGVCVLAAACAGKLLGAAVPARLTGAAPRQALTLGILLNARGLTELVILDVGLDRGLIGTRMFTIMVIMALATTFMTGPLLALTRRDTRAAVTTARV
ncbi:cation:proton antiporter [Streptomyces sp. NPDC005648]|uniref:cation:proton antiporter n=1 Tax=Streptomyces sp. NPDC005648 TaxID=3157044 RepID=UPI0033AEB701